MKLKVLIILFNTILLTIFFAVFSVSFVTAGTEFIGNFFKNYWIFIAFFICLFTVVNLFFLDNWRMITALEAEDWEGLSVYLETELFENKRLTFKKVRIFSEISILLGDFENLRKLEAVLSERRPRYLQRLAARFAAAKLLSGDYTGLAQFTANMVSEGKKTSPWIKFYDAFSEQLLKNYPAAAGKFSVLLAAERHPLIRLLSLYFIACGLYVYLDMSSDEIKRFIETEKTALQKYPAAYWEKGNAKEKQHIHVLVLTKAIDEAVGWLMGNEKGQPNQQY
ncbi:MAG: hypothetical protein P1P65_02445 [Treponema sp.]